MEYRTTLLQFITEGRQEEMGKWIKSHSALDRLDIMNAFKELMEELAAEKGIDMDEDFDAFESAITNYQEKVLDEQLASLKLDMAEKGVEEKLDEAENSLKQLRKGLIETILCHPANETELREVAANIMRLEKENNVFDPENWKALL